MHALRARNKAPPLARLQQRPLLGIFINPLGKNIGGLELNKQDLSLFRLGQMSSVSLQTITSPPVVYKNWLGASLTISLSGSEDAVLKGARHSEALAFAEEVKKAWVAVNLDLLKAEEARISRIYDVIVGLSQPAHYPAACILSPLLDEAKALDAKVLSKLQPQAIGPEATARIQLVRRFTANPAAFRKAAADAFVASSLEHWKEFFDSIESKPLTPEQRLSVVVDEDATLVLAGAGSGKTSVITAKAAYLVKAGIRRPDEILLLAFAKDAAAEMSKRVNDRSGVPIKAQTFHALAYGIIGKVEGSKPALAPQASDDLLFVNIIRQILMELFLKLTEVAKAVIQWFAHFLVESKTEWDFKTKHDFYKHMEQQDLRTLQGETVKSYEELQIANWLYENGIEYEYEPNYEHKVSTGGRRDYCPDFRLTESGVYVEHFGVRRQRMPDGNDRLFTAPFIDRDEYLRGMTWKRQVHAENQTTLIETYSYERQEGTLLSGLAEKLSPHVALQPRPLETIFDRVVQLRQVDSFSQLLTAFLRKFKGGGYSVADCEAKSVRMKFAPRAKAFLAVFEPVFQEYQRRLDGRIDFEDMVLRAARYVETGRYVSSFRHILVDEFQDISQGRARLVKALKAQHRDARIFAVGDDWQSIFRFAGSDIHLMRYFGDEFGGTFNGETGVHRTVDLGRTFRSVDQIALAAKTFVLKNPAQISKNIIPAGKATEPAIRIVMTQKNGEDKALRDLLSDISGKASLEAQTSVLLLGRYRSIKPDIATLQRQFPKLRISFKTIHASKGLEADHVILLKADSGRMGFPSEMVDDPLLSLVSPEQEPFEYAEERRVMYVAMTRARHTLTILASEAKPSSFVMELMQEPAYASKVVSGEEAVVYGCRECGGHLLSSQSQAGRIFYSCEHASHCKNWLPACSACGSAIPERSNGSAEARCRCGQVYPACRECQSGWMVERSGKYGKFLNCVRYKVCDGKVRVKASDAPGEKRVQPSRTRHPRQSPDRI
ncbi:helicase IV [Agrobacterium tumefaciens]|uniref:DNA 3'-5' helicase n=1 Tax=Agrobacterium tumefaciens TaxID=358 RepID=A0AAE6BQ62_AGRTU|nr:helicase IV [Agrobacterium tumefaciens]